MTRRSIAHTHRAGVACGVPRLVLRRGDPQPVARRRVSRFYRGQLLGYLLVPDDVVACWTGTPEGFSLIDRLPGAAAVGDDSRLGRRAGMACAGCLGSCKGACSSSKPPFVLRRRGAQRRVDLRACGRVGRLAPQPSRFCRSCRGHTRPGRLGVAQAADSRHRASAGSLPGRRGWRDCPARNGRRWSSWPACFPLPS